MVNGASSVHIRVVHSDAWVVRNAVCTSCYSVVVCFVIFRLPRRGRRSPGLVCSMYAFVACVRSAGSCESTGDDPSLPLLCWGGAGLVFCPEVRSAGEGFVKLRLV